MKIPSRIFHVPHEYLGLLKRTAVRTAQLLHTGCGEKAMILFVPSKNMNYLNSVYDFSAVIECLCRWHRETMQFPIAVSEVVWIGKPMT